MNGDPLSPLKKGANDGTWKDGVKVNLGFRGGDIGKDVFNGFTTGIATMNGQNSQQRDLFRERRPFNGVNQTRKIDYLTRK